MRDDILAKRMFLAGCFGLPWLWAVHSLYWYRKQQPNHAHDDDHQDALLATPSSSDTDGMSFRFFIKCVLGKGATMESSLSFDGMTRIT
jgi:hypothetical protein